MLGDDHLLQVSLDVRMRWNSTLKMVTRALDLKDSITKFLKFFRSPLAKQEFKGSKTKLDDIEKKEWAILQGISHLLGSLESATRYLSGEKYASFVTALPVLWSIEDKIGNKRLFEFENSDLERSKFKRNFHGQYGNKPFFNGVVWILNACRVLLLNEFISRFEGINEAIVWTTLLDPRFHMKSEHFKNEAESTMAKELLMEKVEEVAVCAATLAFNEENNTVESSSSDESEDENAINLFSSRKKHKSNTKLRVLVATATEQAKAQAKQEVLSYLVATEALVNSNFDPLEWWIGNKMRYPNVAVVARQWLSVPATSTPSERVFSICGIVNTAKRSSSSGKSIENQVFIHNNKGVLE